MPMMDISESSDSPLPSLPSQPESIRRLSCRWAWCRCTFLDSATLVHHVVHEHARSSIPVRRRDIAMIRRIEEGSSQEEVSQLSRDAFQLQEATHSTPVFASFNSPAATPFQLSIPPSPSFNTLVSRIKEQQSGVDDNKSKNATLSQSSSLASQTSVAIQLTQQSLLGHEGGDKYTSDSDSGVERQDSESSGSSSTSTVAESDSDEGTSKFQYESFPIHHHGPKRKPSPHTHVSLQVDSTSRAPMPLRSTIPLSSPKSVSNQKSPTNLSEGVHSLMSSSRKPKTSKKKRIFRSGTLQITPVSLAAESTPEGQQRLRHIHIDLQAMHNQSPEFNATPDYDMDSQSSEESSYPPLQTQAPYESQNMSQF